MADKESLVSQRSTSPVHLNVYDIINSTLNRCLHLVGFGFYHTCVQVHGKQYMFKAGEGEGSGIISGEQDTLPWCEGLHKQVSILIGQTRLDENQVQDVIQELGNDYTKNSYNFVSNNSNHFANRLCLILTGNRIPSWVNRITRLCGLFCGCMLPVEKVNAEIRPTALVSAGVNENPNDGNYHPDYDDDDDDEDDDHLSLREVFMAGRKYAAETSRKEQEDDIIVELSTPSTLTNMPDLLRRREDIITALTNMPDLLRRIDEESKM